MPKKLTSAAVISQMHQLEVEIDKEWRKARIKSDEVHRRTFEPIRARMAAVQQLCPHEHLEPQMRIGKRGCPEAFLGRERRCEDCGMVVDTAGDRYWALDELLRHLTPNAIRKAIDIRVRKLKAESHQLLKNGGQKKKKKKRKKGG